MTRSSKKSNPAHALSHSRTSRPSRSPHASSRLHTSRQRTGYTTPTKAKKIILPVILLAFLAVAAALAITILNTPEHRITSTIATLATDYYEHYLYPTLDPTDPEMSRYEQHGFAPVTLRQLLLYDNQKNSSYSAELLKYCDESATSVRIYPDPPYGASDYHINYTYSCTF